MPLVLGWGVMVLTVLLLAEEWWESERRRAKVMVVAHRLQLGDHILC